MKKLLLFFLFLVLTLCIAAQETEINGCTITHYTWGKLSSSTFEAYGNVYVETNPNEPVDMYVKIVDSPDKSTYRIFKTTDTPKKCGEWRFVSDRSKAKFTIRYVKELEDCRIYFTNDRSNAGFF